MVCRAQVRTGLGKSDRPGSQGGFEKRGQPRLRRSGARTQFRARQPHARLDGRGLETEATTAMVEAKAARGETPAGAPDLQPNHSPPRQPPTLLVRDSGFLACLRW